MNLCRLTLPKLLILTMTMMFLTSSSPLPYHISLRPQEWTVKYDGHGKIDFYPGYGIILNPMAPTANEETHAALVIPLITQDRPMANFEITVVFANEEQLRKPVANPWEVFWLFFNYRSKGPDKKETNYLIFKPNGLEVGVAKNEVSQFFLHTQKWPSMEMGRIYVMTLTKVGRHLEVVIDGRKVIRFNGHGLYDVPGSIGLYTEDARVHIYSVTFRPINYS